MIDVLFRKTGIRGVRRANISAALPPDRFYSAWSLFRNRVSFQLEGKGPFSYCVGPVFVSSKGDRLFLGGIFIV